MYEQTRNEMVEDFTTIKGLKPGETYEFRVVAVDGEYMTDSDPQDIETYSVGKIYSYTSQS